MANIKNNNVNTVSIYQDDEYVYLKNEFEQIQKNIGMYISKGGTEGALHLFKELFNNSLDEANNPHSPSDKINISFSEETGEFIVTDEGRGIPFDKLREVCTQKHTSSKFVRTNEWSKQLAGRHGVGLTVATALSSYISFTSYRGYEYKMIEFIDGEIKDHPISKLKKEQHGFSVRMVPSQKYLGAEEPVNITIEMIEDYLRKMSYIIPPNIKVKLYAVKNEDDKMVGRTYTYQGLSSNVEYLGTVLEFPPVDIKYENNMFDLLISFSYDKTLDESLINSYCNYIHTSEGGSHEIASQRALCEFFSREARKLDPNSKFEVTFDDCKKGLILCINCMHSNPGFEGQHKSRVSNKDIISNGKRGLQDELYRYFNNNNSLLRKIVTYLRQISRIRAEAHKIKGISVRKPTTFLEDAEIRGFKNISDRNYTGYTELLVSEGVSAGSALMNNCNGKHQGIYGLTGVTDNVYGLSVSQLLQKETFRNLIKILGCGAGKEFNINNLKWNKVIICSDADIDGDNITSLLLCFFLLFMRPLIEEGKVYKAVPPLYLLDKRSLKKYRSGEEWLYDKAEYYQLLNTMISDNVDIAFEGPNGEIEKLNRHKKMGWLTVNSEYNIELDGLVKRAVCSPIILEHVCYFKLITQGDEFKFKDLIESKFNELLYDIEEKSLYGSYNREFVALIIDSLFMKMARRFISVLNQNDAFYIICKNKNDNDDKWDRLTIGQFLEMMYGKYNLKIEQRFKGLGELGRFDLFSTTMNPKMRKLIRLTINDAEDALKIFELLHGKTDVLRERRRELLENTIISYADIDN